VKFNNQFQTTELTLGTSASNGNRLKLEYDYGTTDNNGNVKSQTITVPTMMMPNVGLVQGFTATQTYSYDELNRLKSAIETGNQTNWQQHFRYDRYGNRTVITEQNRVGQEAFTTSSIVGLNPDINIANNRIVPKPNSTEQYQFDASGNMTRDAVGNLYTYDAENHQKSYTPVNPNEPSANYFYDGDGRRVKKQVGNEMTIFVYDGGGALVAEYTQNAPASTTPPQTVFLTADTLGSPRINTNQSGQVVARHDYLPFGDEIIGLGQRTSEQGYGMPDGVRKKFTGYEKDQETGLDFAQARYYGEGLGRFTSVDPKFESAKLDMPQSWNRYSYVINNPLAYTDPTGEDYNIEIIIGSDGKEHPRPVYVDCIGCGNWAPKYGYVFQDVLTGKWWALNPYKNESQAFDTEAEAGEQLGLYEFRYQAEGLAHATEWIPEAYAILHGGSILLGANLGAAIVAGALPAEMLLPAAASHTVVGLQNNGVLSDDPLGINAPPIAATVTVDGPFSISDWSDYPQGNVPRPNGPFRLLEGQEYVDARDAANSANRGIHRNNPSLSGSQIHEIQPVKWGGSPTDPTNKVALPPHEHSRYTTWWRRLQRNITRGR
jgi:RHS repeat-associated protein